MTTGKSEEHGFRFPINVDSLTAEGRAKLGELVKQRRMVKGLTQTELSIAAGVDRKTLGTIESGKRAGQADKLRALLEALDVPQSDDVDRRYSEATRSFIASTAPIFDQLPESAQADAQSDVVTLLAGKLMRSVNVPTSVDDLAMRRPRTMDQSRIAADMHDMNEQDVPAPGEHPND